MIAPPTKRGSKKLLWLIISSLLLAAAGYGGYYYGARGKTDDAKKPAVQTTVQTVTVPKDATLTAGCVEGRGKQYILPKDIPNGPIYDVHDGKVIALEFLVASAQLTSTPDKFSALSLPSGAYDHLAVISVDPHAGLAEIHFHVVAYLISRAEAKQITCQPGSSSDINHSQ